LIVANVVSLQVVLISALHMCNGCRYGEVLQSLARGPLTKKVYVLHIPGYNNKFNDMISVM